MPLAEMPERFLDRKLQTTLLPRRRARAKMTDTKDESGVVVCQSELRYMSYTICMQRCIAHSYVLHPCLITCEKKFNH